MNSRERLLTAIAGQRPDHVPLVCRCFGFAAPPELAWTNEGHPVPFWYTMRLDHIHTLPEPWDSSQDFRRVDAWLSVGLDDVLEVSVPWSADPRVAVRDYEEESQGARVACREYSTPAGTLTHRVTRTGEHIEPGWVVQPAYPSLFEDFNIPRSIRPPIAEADDLPKLACLLQRPFGTQLNTYCHRMAQVRRFAESRGVLVCGWSLFGMDGVVWLCGAEAAVIMAMEQPDLFAKVVELVDQFDRMRTELMLEIGGVDLVVQRGWYSTTNFWSPRLFEQHVLPRLKANVRRVHAAGAKFAYVMTTGARPLLGYLAEAGVDLYYWADPVQGGIELETVRDRLKGKVAIAGGVNAPITLGKGSEANIRKAVREAVETLGPDGFVLEPVDSLFPDTPWLAVRTMIDEWKRVCRLD